MEIEVFATVHFVDESISYSTLHQLCEWNGDGDFALVVKIPVSEYKKALEMKIKRIEKELDEMKKKLEEK